jgi:hypothetical protein
MKRLVFLSALVAAAMSTALWAADVPAAPAGGAGAVATPTYPEKIATMPIEVCFVLDTTGSMSGLIEGAKQKIWSIANSIIKDNPKSTLKIALVPYRDRGDDYITKVIDLTDDLDSMYKELMAFGAGGGGDEPESVNQALQDAVEKVSWGGGPGAGGKAETIRLVFLVGDSPPHMDYPDDVKYTVTIEKAVKKNIIVDTVQCGDRASTTPFWKEIARLGEGQYLPIAQSGNMVAIQAPQDARLAELSAELAKTVVPYGSARQQNEVISKNALNSAPASEATAARVTFNGGRGGGGRAVSGAGDLTKDIEANGKLLDTLKVEELPVPMQKMTPAEQQAYLDKQIAQRKVINDEIAKVSKERDAYIKTEAEKNVKADSFDVKVIETIQSNAAAARAAAATRNK